MPAKKNLEVIMGNGNSSHLTKEEIEKRQNEEIKIETKEVISPSYLPKGLKTEFDRIAGRLLEIGIISDLDSMSLARFIVAEYQYEEITKKMLSITTPNKIYKNLSDLQDKFFKQARASANDLGLTITSRCKLVLPKNDDKREEEDPFDFLFGK